MFAKANQANPGPKVCPFHQALFFHQSFVLIQSLALEGHPSDEGAPLLL